MPASVLSSAFNCTVLLPFFAWPAVALSPLLSFCLILVSFFDWRHRSPHCPTQAVALLSRSCSGFLEIDPEPCHLSNPVVPKRPQIGQSRPVVIPKVLGYVRDLNWSPMYRIAHQAFSSARHSFFPRGSRQKASRGPKISHWTVYKQIAYQWVQIHCFHTL